MKILVADDHPVVRRGLIEILSEHHAGAEFGEAQDSHEVLERVREQRWDVLILDLTMPGRGGLDVLKDVKRERPNLPVLVLTVHPEDQYAVRALRAGAAGYLTKEAVPEELPKAVTKILTGSKYITDRVAQQLASAPETLQEKPALASLSDREYQVMLMIASGKMLHQIARELSLSPKTVSTYRAGVLTKTKMKNNAEITRFVIENRLLP